MNKKLTVFAMFTLFFSLPATSALQKAAPQKQTQSLAHGDGWQLVRSVQLGNTSNYIHMVLIDRERDMDKAVYGAALNKLCRSEPDFCRVRFWNEARHVSESISFTDAQFKALRAEYIFNRAGNLQQMRYACTVVPDKNQCFSH